MLWFFEKNSSGKKNFSLGNLGKKKKKKNKKKWEHARDELIKPKKDPEKNRTQGQFIILIKY